MELIKKKFKIVTTTGHTTGFSSGCTGSSCYVIIPYSGTGITYNMNILLSSNATDWGFFETLYDPNATGLTGSTISGESYLISGSSSSRLSELRKFAKSGGLASLYFTSVDPSIDGLDLSLTYTGYTASTYVYYIGGITYMDFNVSGETPITIFVFESLGTSSPAFDNLPIVKYEEEQNLILKPIIGNNVFIIREELSAFENNYRLRNIRNITELYYYAGGAYFNIVKNT